ncbi:MAG: tetratricopeptide repeat protein [Candidatus Rokubacteria bacterium]|nr:tetratricopeptide repeat protein [Candidatus Rokubacteria bacterium]
MSLISSLRTLAWIGHALGRVFGPPAAAAPDEDDPRAAELLRQAAEARRSGRGEEAAILYRQVLQRHRGSRGALRGLRDLAVEGRRWPEALEAQQRLVAQAAPGERGQEAEWLAALHYEAGREEAGRGALSTAIGAFRSALRADRNFLPAALALGDVHAQSGDQREAIRTWERAAESRPALPLLTRLEQAYRREGKPSRMIALYRSAVERAPDDLAVALALGRVYFELEMLDEAVDQFEKVEVHAPDLPVVHAFLGAVFERRGAMRDAFEEYRRALRLGHAFDWPYRCAACGAVTATWLDRCAQCGRWNTLGPADGR